MLVCFVSLIHILWGLLLLANGSAIETTATSVLRHAMPSYELRALCYIVSGLLPLALLRWPGSIFSLLSGLPQQMLLLLSGCSAFIAITSGHYADGVIRPAAFIAMDQSIYILLAVLYSFETLDRFHERGPRERER